MSSYPVLDNRSIDQWKVTELKEELKRRKLTTKGLKDDLIKRLAEAIHSEHEAADAAANNGFDGNKPITETEAAGTVPDVTEPACNMTDHVDNQNDVDGQNFEVLTENRMVSFDEGKALGGEVGAEADSTVKEEVVVQGSNVETNLMGTTGEINATENDNVMPEIAVSVQESQNDYPQSENRDLKAEVESQDIRGLSADVKLDSSEPSNQVPVVSPTLGFQVKSDSISCDNISNNEKNELKDNIIADDVKLELDVKPEMVQPSSSNVLPDGGFPCPMDVEKPPETEVLIDEGYDQKATDAEMSEKNDTADFIPSERLNLDRSSGDDSIEDDALEGNRLDSKNACSETRDSVVKTETPLVVEEAPVVVMKVGSPVEKLEMHDENKNAFAAPSVKRKPLDQEVTGNNNISKRQRRWNSNNLEVPERQNSIGSSTIPKGAVPPNTMKHDFSRSDSTASVDTPKERIVPPSPKPPTNSLRIDRFLRPFTLKAVQELLGKTGTVTSFWMDHIKTHCYVTYSSAEEAMETRNAVYNLQWPPNGGRLLVAEFVDPQEVKMRAEASPSTATPVTPAAAGPPAPAASQHQPATRQVQQTQRQQLPPPPLPLPPPPLPVGPPLAKPSSREWLTLPPPPPPPPPEKVDPPILTLDDLFRKTKATPRIYYLPLSDEQVAAKLKAQGKCTKQ